MRFLLIIFGLGLYILAIYWGVSIGLSVGETSPAWGVTWGIVCTVLFCIIAAAINARFTGPVLERYRNWLDDRRRGY